MREPDRPALATTDAGWLRQVSRAVTLLIIVAAMAMLFRAGGDALAEGERMALDHAEQDLKNLVWLKAQRSISEEGIDSLRALVGQDPRQWATDIAPELNDAPRPSEVPEWANERWRFDVARGELVYRPVWLPGGERRWRIEAVESSDDSSTPGLARDLLLTPVNRSSPSP